MKPIINPLWFYLIGISEGLVGASLAIGILSIIGAAVMLIFYFCEQDMRCPNEKLVACFKKNSKRCFIIGLIGIFIATFIPSEKTCYQMMAASIITPNNIETVIDTTKDSVEWLVDTITEASNKLADKEESADE